MKTFPIQPGTYILTMRICPNCGSNFYEQGTGILHCSNEKCNTSETHLIGGPKSPKFPIAAIVHLKQSAIS